MVYMVVLVLNPTQKQVFDEGTVPMIVAGPSAVIADTDTAAAAKAMQLLPEELKAKADRVEVSVMPFRSSR